MDPALPVLREVKQLCLASGNLAQFAVALNLEASILFGSGQLEEALRTCDETERICFKIGNKVGVAASRGNRALACRRRGDLAAALRLLKSEEDTLRETGVKNLLAISLANQADLLTEMGKPGEAYRRISEAHAIASNHGYQELAEQFAQLRNHLAQTHGIADEKKKSSPAESVSALNQGMIFLQMGRIDQAVAILKDVDAALLDEAEKAASRQQDRNALVVYCGLALAMKAKGDRVRSLALTVKHEQLARKLGLKAEVAVALGNRANIHWEDRDYDKALELHHEKEVIAREVRDANTLAFALINQGLLLSRELCRPEEGLPKAVEAYQLVVQHGLTDLQRRMIPTIGMLLNAALDQAVTLTQVGGVHVDTKKPTTTSHAESRDATRRRGSELLKQVEATADAMNQPQFAELARKAGENAATKSEPIRKPRKK